MAGFGKLDLVDLELAVEPQLEPTLGQEQKQVLVTRRMRRGRGIWVHKTRRPTCPFYFLLQGAGRTDQTKEGGRPGTEPPARNLAWMPTVSKTRIPVHEATGHQTSLVSHTPSWATNYSGGILFCVGRGLGRSVLGVTGRSRCGQRGEAKGVRWVVILVLTGDREDRYSRGTELPQMQDAGDKEWTVTGLGGYSRFQMTTEFTLALVRP